jgi:pyruvate,water dikinase
MVSAESSGVAFSRNPIKPLDREHCLVSSVWGLGEGLVSGELDADHFEVHRDTFKVHETIVEKTHAFHKSELGGLVKKDVPLELQKKSSLTPEEVRNIASLVINLEVKLGSPQDCEFAIEAGKLYCVQTRPITTLPPDSFFNEKIKGAQAILWDNSNIIESYSGVTSPLTFTFASQAYRQVYIQFCEIMGVPKEAIVKNEPMYRNMLGLIRGRIYYNLINWYKLVLMLPGTGSNKGFMETMMGVKQGLKPELAYLFDFMRNPPQYSLTKKLQVTFLTLWRFLTIDTIIGNFNKHFLKVYNEARRQNFREMSLNELSDYYQMLDTEILGRWHAPIINDYLCMIFFGGLKKLTEKWLGVPGDAGASLQNDLLCGQGDLESTEPTKMLMAIADEIDNGPAARREWFVSTPAEESWNQLKSGKSPELFARFNEFLDKYGFRCVNELKLEELDLHDDPTFVIHAVGSYVRMKTYSIKNMEERERAIKEKAEGVVHEKLRGFKRTLFFWVLKQARRAVKNRENLRFARTKIFGIARHIFRAMGEKFTQLGEIANERDIFYLTTQEIQGYVEGRAISMNIKSTIAQRKSEFGIYNKTPPPPDRLLTYGAAGVTMKYAQVLSDSDLLRSEVVSDDPNILLGVSCCPGVVEGVVRVVHELKDAMGLNGEILVTGRTDPGWVPLYPSCSGLLIERGSLLSHSAVVARELGLPTIVGISGGLMKKLKTGQRVRVDAGKGEIRIL